MKFFITGTDTGIGKTYVSVGLLRKFNELKFSTFGIKPIASGCQRVGSNLYNDDALALQRTASIKMPYEYVNPIALESPIAPHLAAKLNDQILSKDDLVEKINQFFKLPADVFIVEGIGGWFVPLNKEELLSDMVKLLKIPVILVVGIKLGCLNHTLLTIKAMNQEKIPLLGWVANCIYPTFLSFDEHVETLRTRIEVPCLGIIPYDVKAESVLCIQSLLNSK